MRRCTDARLHVNTWGATYSDQGRLSANATARSVHTRRQLFDDSINSDVAAVKKLDFHRRGCCNSALKQCFQLIRVLHCKLDSQYTWARRSEQMMVPVDCWEGAHVYGKQRRARPAMQQGPQAGRCRGAIDYASLSSARRTM